MNYIRARGIDDEDFKSSQVTAVIGPPTPSLAQFQPQLRNIGKKKTKSTKSQFNQCLGSFFFFQFRVYSRCFNTIRILYTLFLRVNTF